jgi:hypothetical protein
MARMFVNLRFLKPSRKSDGKREDDIGREAARRALNRALEFVDTAASKWREERKCATCHLGTMTVWVLSEAKSQGFQISADTLKSVTEWTKERLANVDPGFRSITVSS